MNRHCTDKRGMSIYKKIWSLKLEISWLKKSRMRPIDDNDDGAAWIPLPDHMLFSASPEHTM